MFALALLLAIFTGPAGFNWQPARLHKQDSTRINGLDGPITIMRDAAGVPHIRATTEADAPFGLGYAHAQDRLWQMEVPRQLASGRTAAFLGAPGLQAGVLFRTVGLTPEPWTPVEVLAFARLFVATGLTSPSERSISQ